MLRYSNEDGTAATVASVKALIGGTEVTLVAGTDYKVIATTLGATAIELVQGTKLTASAPNEVKLTVTYSTTAPNTKVVEHKANALAKGFVMVLVHEFDYNGSKKIIRTYLANCQASKAVRKSIADSDATTVGMPLEITGTIIKEDKIGFGATA